MALNQLSAISPVDGRYHAKTSDLSIYFSEYALIKYRVLVEIEYFIALCELPLPKLKTVFDEKVFEQIRRIYQDFSEDDAQKVKDIEQTTNHDVKAVEYFIKQKFDELNLSDYKEYIHFGLTSQDINNTSFPKMVKDALLKVYLPTIRQIVAKMEEFSEEWSEVPMLAKTHGQPASPTILGKEIKVFVERIEGQLKLLEQIPFSAKFGGATGNFNAHHIAYPEMNWMKFADNFVSNSLGLKRSKFTTQIEHYDNLGALFDTMKRINIILIDFSRDVWQYISMEYFKQKIVANEVGSSAMPHKVNPIDFENAEGNLGIANAIFEHLTVKLPISRLQRDLTDSTVLRNVGVPFAHTQIAFLSLLKGMNKLKLNVKALQRDLNENWAVVAEAIQTVLRREGYPQPYEKLKELTRSNSQIGEVEIKQFIANLDVNQSIKDELELISPHNYTGINMII